MGDPRRSTGAAQKPLMFLILVGVALSLSRWLLLADWTWYMVIRRRHGIIYFGVTRLRDLRGNWEGVIQEKFLLWAMGINVKDQSDVGPAYDRHFRGRRKSFFVLWVGNRKRCGRGEWGYMAKGKSETPRVAEWGNLSQGCDTPASTNLHEDTALTAMFFGNPV